MRAVDQTQRWLTCQQHNYSAWKTHQVALEEPLQRFQAENAANPAPLEALFRLEAGFGTPENLVLLIEMGYAIYSKPYGTWFSGLLAEKGVDAPYWQLVCTNAEIKAWKAATVPDFPYPLDLGVVRFWQGDSDRRSALLHFGQPAGGLCRPTSLVSRLQCPSVH